MQKLRSCPSHPALLRLFAGLLVLLCGTVPAWSDTEGLLPSLDTEPAAETPAMTPITELIGQPEQVEPGESVAKPTPVSAAPADISLKTTRPATSGKQATQPEKPATLSGKPSTSTEKKNENSERKTGS